MQPPTDDDEALYATIDRLVPQSGTSLGRGILTSLNLVAPDSGSGSDGENQVDRTETENFLAPCSHRAADGRRKYGPA